MSLVDERPRSAAASDLSRVDAPEKVTGAARYAYEHRPDQVAYAHAVCSTIAKGRVARVDDAAALARPATLAVLSHANAPRLPGRDDLELAVLQSPDIAYHGQVVALVVATTLEAAVEAAELVVIEYDAAAHDSVLRDDHPRLYAPDHVNPSFPTDSVLGDADDALARAPFAVDATYVTPYQHNNPMEPHAVTAWWNGPRLTLYDSIQGTARARGGIAAAFGMAEADVHLIYPYVGGGFGSKGLARPHSILAAMAARVVDRPVKLAVTRQQMFAMTGYRTPTIQRVRLGAAADGTLSAISHEVWEQTSTLREFAEQTAVGTRHLYAAPHRRTTHRLVALDVPTPSWMRAPGEAPGVFALECAMDELAVQLGMDPVALRIRNEPDVDPESGQPFSSRHLVECLRAGADRFGWNGGRPRPGRRRDGRWFVGTGVAASMYPARAQPSSARATVEPDGRWLIEIDAADIGTGARTALLGFAAERTGAPPGDITLAIADSALPAAMIAGGSMGTASWTWAIAKAVDAVLADTAGGVPAGGATAEVSTADEVRGRPAVAGFSYGAQFADVRVDADTGEVRISRLTGVFAAGRILNARMARSQLIGGMTMGASMALLEEGILDPTFGDVVNHDLAQYHVAVNADIDAIDATWLDEDEDTLGPAGAKGVGEVGIVGTAAAVANAVHDATGVRVRDLPIRLDKLLERPP